MMKLKIDRLQVEADAKTIAYVKKKIGKLDLLLSQHARKSAHADVKLKRGPGRGRKQFTC